MIKMFNTQNIELTKYMFFTGKGGVGKTSTACATALTLSDSGKKVLLISTDPASNLQDVFNMTLDNKGTIIQDAPNLKVANLDPIQAAEEYKENLIAPYRGKLPDAVINNMEEQLSGSCTVEIAAFNEFSKFITDQEIQNEYDHIIFDTAPTGHTLRMLQLPSAWSDFISESTHGASCLGQLSGLENQKEMYKKAVSTLADGNTTTLVIVSRPEISPLMEAERASSELRDIGVENQILILNGMMTKYDDVISKSLFDKQQNALLKMPQNLKSISTYSVPLRGYNILGLENVRSLFIKDKLTVSDEKIISEKLKGLKDIVTDLYDNNRKVIFTMGKGGVGKTTIAAAIAIGLAEKGVNVHLTTTDPAAHLKYVIDETPGITMSHIDENEELLKYKEEVLSEAKKTMSEDDVAYIEEDLQSPCTQEIAVFRAFAEIVDKSDNEVVIIDTAPTGHTLLLLESTESYNKEILRSKGTAPESVRKLLPKLHNSEETEVIIVTLPEATPVYEAMRLEEDLKRTGINNKWWIINSSLYETGTTNQMLIAKASNEIEWINKIDKHSNGLFSVIPWKHAEIKGNNLKTLLG